MKNLFKVLFGKNYESIFVRSTPVEERVIRSYYGLGEEAKSFKEIAASFRAESSEYSHVSEKNVKRVFDRGMRRLKKRFS